MNGITVRRATAADRAAIGELWWEMMEFHRECDPRFFRLKPDAREIWLKHLDECLADGNQLVLVAEGEGEVVGLAMGRPGEDPPVFSAPPHGFVTNFVVARESRRHGVGKRLFEALAREFHQRGLTDLRLSVAAANPASRAFWQRMGFEEYSLSMRLSAKGR